MEWEACLSYASYPSVGLRPGSQVGGWWVVQRAGAGRESGFLLPLSPSPPLPVPIHPTSWAALGRAAANCREGQARGCPPHPGGIPVTCQWCTMLHAALVCLSYCIAHCTQGIPGHTLLLLHRARVKIMPARVHQGHTRGEWSRAPKTQAGCLAPPMHHGHSGGLWLFCTDAEAFAPWNIATRRLCLRVCLVFAIQSKSVTFPQSKFLHEKCNVP